VLSFHRLAEDRGWSEREIAVLRLTAELFTSVIRRRQAEQELAESQRRLVQSQKMEAVGTLAGGIAHDFNNQLTVMLGNARFVMGEVTDPELREVLGDLTRAAEHCAQLTRSLLAFSRRKPTTQSVVDVHRIVSDSVDLLRPLIPRSIEFVLSQPKTQGRVRADPVQLQQVLVNLAVNARDAMPDGGRLRIGVRSVLLPGDRARALGLPKPGAYAEIEVADTGSGMEPEVQRRVFEPFYTTKAPGGGTGLGLATAYGIVQESGGVIEIESVPGHGSTFRVLLPKVQDEESSPEAPEPGATDGVGGTVLVVEDEEAVRRMARRIFEGGGYRVLDAADGVGALEIFDRLGDEIALVAADIEMPRLGGIELARRLARREPAPAVLLFSASHAAPRQDLVANLRTAFVEKPFDEDSLLGAARDLLIRQV
jgi:signal transduction histidine kinase